MEEEEQQGFDLDKVSQDLSIFLDRNPYSKVELGESDSKPAVVKSPWGDPSVMFIIPREDSAREELNECLNNIILPTRLSALYHVDTKELEIIFTARALSEKLKEIDGRKFEFYFEESKFQCRFDTSTNRLLHLAKHAIFPQHTESGFRNLMSFSEYHTFLVDDDDKEEGKEGSEFRNYIKTQYGRPISFFVSNIEWDEEGTLILLRHISFYLRYYDSISPFIVIHPLTDGMSINPKERYVNGVFPTAISSRKLNPWLLSFYIAAADALPENKFLYCYRIIEFVASHYLKNDKLIEVRKILSNPALLSTMEGSIDALVGLIREEKSDSVNRFKSVVNDLTKREVIWPEICSNPDAFTNTVTFDGGFEIAKLVDGVDDISRLAPHSIQAMAHTFRSIRNALAHGGEDQAGKVILPTARNAKLLQPWVHLIVAVAGEVILHENHT